MKRPLQTVSMPSDSSSFPASRTNDPHVYSTQANSPNPPLTGPRKVVDKTLYFK